MTDPSTRPETRDLMTLYHEHIAPELLALEGERKQAVGIAVAVMVASLVLTALLWRWLARLDDIRAFFLPLSLGLCAAIFIIAGIAKQTKSKMVPMAFAHIGWTYSEAAFPPRAFKRYVAFRLLPKHSRAHFEDSVSGEVGGSQFQMVEVRLIVMNGSRSDTVFQGCLLEVDFHENFSSTTVVLRDRGLLNSKKLKGKAAELKPVGMASPKWEKLFEAYSTDQVEARVKLDPDFMERLMALETKVDGKNLRFGFFDGRLHVMVETPNRFEPGSMFMPLADPWRMKTLIGEIEAICAVVESVQKPGMRRRETSVGVNPYGAAHADPLVPPGDDAVSTPASQSVHSNPYDPEGLLLSGRGADMPMRSW